MLRRTLGIGGQLVVRSLISTFFSPAGRLIDVRCCFYSLRVVCSHSTHFFPRHLVLPLYCTNLAAFWVDSLFLCAPTFHGLGNSDNNIEGEGETPFTSRMGCDHVGFLPLRTARGRSRSPGRNASNGEFRISCDVPGWPGMGELGPLILAVHRG